MGQTVKAGGDVPCQSRVDVNIDALKWKCPPGFPFLRWCVKLGGCFSPSLAFDATDQGVREDLFARVATFPNGVCTWEVISVCVYLRAGVSICEEV